jgi:hypothetical protein
MFPGSSRGAFLKPSVVKPRTELAFGEMCECPKMTTGGSTGFLWFVLIAGGVLNKKENVKYGIYGGVSDTALPLALHCQGHHCHKWKYVTHVHICALEIDEYHAFNVGEISSKEHHLEAIVVIKGKP